MSSRQLSLLNHRLNFLGEVKDSKCVGDCGARLRKKFGNLFLSAALLLDELAVPTRLLKGAQVRTLEILDEGKLENFLIADLFNDDGYLSESSKLRRLVTSLSRHNLVLRTLLTDEKWLKDAVLLN